MKIKDEVMKKIHHPGLDKLEYIFRKYDHEFRIAGGPVRDILIGLTPQDLDFATTATPQEMKSFFEKESIRMLNRNGEEHGTITVRICDTNFECTTLRLDKKTDGRHAEVEFIRDWEMDAKRRDLTINAMYLGMDGTVYDYCNGIEHLKRRFVTFVGNASERIKEDYLRILRYFRFFGRISETDLHNEDIIQSIKENVIGLSTISGERILVELKKIVTGRYGYQNLNKMKECSIFHHIGLKEDFNIENFNKIYNQCDLNKIKAVSLLAAGICSKDDITNFVMRVKCSNKDKKILYFILDYRDKEYSETKAKNILIDLKYKMNMNSKEIQELIGELALYNGCKTEQFAELKLPIFPINGGHLQNIEGYKRKSKLSELLDIWKNSDYTLTCEELMTYI